MVSTVDEKCKDEIQEDFETEATSNAYNNNNNQIPHHIRISQEGNRDGNIQTNKFLDMIRKTMAVSGSPTAKFRQIAQGRDEFSRSIASPVQRSLPGRFPTRLVRKIKWEPIKGMFWEWIKNPMNMALFLWIVCVAISGAVLFMVMTGMLNDVLTKKSQRNIWFEVSNQILNASFTLMCLYQHPKRFHHLALLCRWKPKDVLTVRKIYCKNGSYKPNEWMHMMVVVALLHINCFAQYALCSLNLGIRRSKRPAIGVGVCISIAIAAPAVAAVYNILSPLGKEYDLETDYNAHIPTTVGERKPARTTLMSPEKEYTFVSRDGGATENRPVWIGGLSDFWVDIYLAYLSIFCSFCVFGWNMDRLGFGNMYVHITTFILLCMAPFWIFNLAAITIDNETIRVGLGLTGIVLCVFGLMYGGFWRIQMRRRFNLPANAFCCGSPAVTDCIQWLCCCSCSLSQEVRTADFYEIVADDNLDQVIGSTSTPAMMAPLPHEDGLPLFRSSHSSPLWSNTSPVFQSFNSPSPSSFSMVQQENSSVGEKYVSMTPPMPLTIQSEGNQATQHGRSSSLT